MRRGGRSHIRTWSIQRDLLITRLALAPMVASHTQVAIRLRVHLEQCVGYDASRLELEHRQHRRVALCQLEAHVASELVVQAGRDMP